LNSGTATTPAPSSTTTLRRSGPLISAAIGSPAVLA
jgi:hypothetical protein